MAGLPFGNSSGIKVVRYLGFTVKVGTPLVEVLAIDKNGMVLESRGATVPTAADAGYAKGSRFIKTDGGAGTTWYVNEGSETSASFAAVEASGDAGVLGTTTVTSASASALAVGANGATAPVLKINAATASVATGIEITGAASGAGVAIAAIGGAAEALTINAKGTGTIGIGSVSTGAVTITPATTITGALTLSSSLSVAGALTSTTQALSGAGAVNLTTLITKITSTGANALTLANGVDGQVKILSMVVDGGDATLTPTTKTGYSTIVFNDAGDGCTLVYTTTTGWMVVSNNGCTIS